MMISDFCNESNYESIVKIYEEVKRYLDSFNLNEDELDEILQDTVITTWQKIHTLRDEERLTSWAKAIAQNKMKRYHRKRSLELERFCSLEELDSGEEYGKVPDELVYRDLENFTDSEIYELIMRLGKPASTIFILHYVYQEPLIEIANTLKMNPNTVRSIALRGRERIKSWISESEDSLRTDCKKKTDK